MRRYLLDTNEAGAYISRRAGVDLRVREVMSRGDRVGICFPVLGELWAGMELSSNRDRNVELMKHALARLYCWPFDTRAAEEYGRLFAALRRLGRNIQQIDMQVAAIALSLGNTTVVTADNDLKVVPDLVVVKWSTG